VLSESDRGSRKALTSKLVKLRHAAALALVGWYFMVPPMLSATHKYDQHAPLRYWYTLKSFETAAECQKLLEHDKLILAQDGGVAVCISSDDPRLKDVPPAN
jgi:hypothetical protein